MGLLWIFVQHTRQMFDHIDIWEILRQNQHLLLQHLLQTILKNFCSASGWITPRKEASVSPAYCRCFQQWPGTARVLLLVCSYASSHASSCVFWLLSIIASIIFFSNQQKTRCALFFPYYTHQSALAAHDSVIAISLVALFEAFWWALTTAYWYIPQDFEDALNQSLWHHNLTCVSVTHTNMLTLLSCFQHIKVENWLFTWCLIYLTSFR